MLTARVRVVAIEKDWAWVEGSRVSACGSCAVKGTCGTALLGAALHPAPFERLAVRNTLDAQIGDEVLLGLPEKGLLRAMLLLYGLPLTGLMLGLGLFQSAGEGWALLAGAVGLGAGWGILRFLSPVMAMHLGHPCMLERFACPEHTAGHDVP